MTNDTPTRKVDVENWRRGYEAALSGKAFVCVSDEKTSAWRLGYRDGRALRLKLRVMRRPIEAKRCASAASSVWRSASITVAPTPSPIGGEGAPGE